MSSKIKFCGAARTVTGSSHLLTTESGFNVLLDCGLYQGNEDDMENFNREWGFDPSKIDVLVLSHAHIDHSGRIPRLVKDGFRGDIISTSATRDLAAIMLMDSASIQERDAEYINRKREAKGYPPVEPLYTSKDATRALEAFIGISYERWFRLNDEVSILFKDAGHILGSASVTLRIQQAGGKEITLGFTGDIGRPQRPILRDPVPLEACDYVICESTYGGRHHPDLPDDERNLMKIIQEICVDNQSKLLIPAFSVGRTQEIIYMLDRLESRGKLPKVPVYVDSPLAVNATEIFLMHPECYDDEILQYMSTDPNPFGFNGLNYVREVEQSIAINDLKGPAIIVSASGMMQAGRIRHHIRNNIEDPGAGLLVVGYCAPGTLGARIRDGFDEINLFGREYKVKAKVFQMDSFSAHGDEEEMLDYLDQQDRNKLKKIFLVHGDEEAQDDFTKALRKKGFGKIETPHLFQEFNLEV
jgi:metallo-beta-lactamase family protein